MTLRHLSLILFTFLIAIPAAAQSGSFTGTVKNSSGQPLGDMTVQAYNAAGLPITTTTDSQGRYLIVVPAGSYRILAYDNTGTYAVSYYNDAPSYEQSQLINVTGGQQVTANFVLAPGLKISGTVFQGSGAPAQGAVVAAYNLDGTRRTFVTSNADGTYTLTVPAGSYKVVAYHEVSPFIPTFYQNAQLFENATVVTPPALNVQFSLRVGHKIRGTVKEKLTGQPLAGLKVVAYDLAGNVRFRTETNPAGEFAFVVPEGTYKFAAEDPNGLYQTTFYRDAGSFASGATVQAASAPLLQFTVGRIPAEEPTTTLYIPGIIHSAGAAGTFFKTDVWVQNPDAEPVTVTLTFLRAGQDNSGATGVPVTIDGRSQILLEDIVNSFFGTSGAGALRLDASKPVLATSRTYNVPPNAAEIGTFGLSIPAQSIGGSSGRATLTGLAQNGSSRTNIGLLNPHTFEIDVQIEIVSSSGTVLGTSRVTLRPGEWVQQPVAVAGGFDQAYAIVTSENGSFFSYAAVVDAKSGDGTIILPSGE